MSKSSVEDRKPTAEEAEPWIRKAEEWDRKLDSLRDLIQPPFDKADARAALKEFKEELQRESKWASRRIEHAPPVEANYCHMIKQVDAFFVLKVNSDPCSGKWQEQFAYSQVDLGHFVAEIREWIQ